MTAPSRLARARRIWRASSPCLRAVALLLSTAKTAADLYLFLAGVL